MEPSGAQAAIAGESSTPLATPDLAEPNPWGDAPTGVSSLKQSSIARPALSIPPEINAKTHKTIPSISVIDPDDRDMTPASPDDGQFVLSRRQRMYQIMHDTTHLLFPSLHGFQHKSWIGRILAIFAVPAIFCLTITLPVVDDAAEGNTLNGGGVRLVEEESEGGDTEDRNELGDAELGNGYNQDGSHKRHFATDAGHALHHLVDEGAFPVVEHLGHDIHSPSKATGSIDGDVDNGSDIGASNGSDNEEEFLFNKYLTAVQCVLGPIWCSVVIFSDQDWFKWELVGVTVVGAYAAVMTLRRGRDGHNPLWRMVRCFMGFFSAMVWIAAIADEVVQVLQTFGLILGLSDAIIGLTIFAIGSSLADWVANLTVATFAPTMAYAACFGGPMLNILLGVGGAGSYMVASTGRPYPVQVSPTLWVSAIGLIVLLLTTLCFVPLNGFLISRRWGWFLIIFYCILTAINIYIETKHGRG